MITNKLEGFPKVYYINLDDAIDRNRYMLGQMQKYNISNFERYEAKRPAASCHKKLNTAQYGCLTSHIEVLRTIASLGDEYAIVCEDDIDFDTLQHWQFTWQEFFDRLPEFDIVQLFRNKVNADHTNAGELSINFRKWESTDFVAAVYIITKSYAKHIVDQYDNKTLYIFKDLSDRVGPVADFMLFNEGTSYSTSIFTVKIFPSQIDAEVWNVLKNNVKKTNEIIKKKITLDDIFTTYESDNEHVQA